MKKKILIMGLPGAGKTYLAKRLYPYLKAVFLNNDEVRKEAYVFFSFFPNLNIKIINITLNT